MFVNPTVVTKTLQSFVKAPEKSHAKTTPIALLIYPLLFEPCPGINHPFCFSEPVLSNSGVLGRNTNITRSLAEFASEMCDEGLCKEKAVGSCATRWGVGLEHPTDFRLSSNSCNTAEGTVTRQAALQPGVHSLHWEVIWCD